MTLFHIRLERETRERYNLIGKELPPDLFVAWCGETGNTGSFQDAGHALQHMKNGGFYLPCPACLRAIRDLIERELPACDESASLPPRLDEEEE